MRIARWIAVASLVIVLGQQGARAQQDGARQDGAQAQERVHSPSGALIRALVVPGWGQIYNGQYIKLPIVYGAIGGLIYNAMRLHDDYVLYRAAYQYKSFQELVESGSIETNPNADKISAYEALVADFGPISSFPIRSSRDTLRRNRDLSILGVGLAYALSVLDAFVSAHLKDFDVGENLAVRVHPDSRGFKLGLSLAF